MDIELYAFFPYSSGFGSLKKCLGAKVTKVNEHGQWFAPSYQSWVTPFLILPIEPSERINEELNALENQYKRALRELKEHYDELHNTIITIPKK